MRTIKFRAWAKDFETGGHKMIFIDGLNQNMMQFTGLHDATGKEIYEGDTTEIEAENGKMNRFIVKFGIAKRQMASGWIVDIPSFYFDLIGGDFKAFPIVHNYKGIHDLEMMKIIGNIYETPELLEKEGREE